jgi:uncharacterized protein YjbI with pentapeptide repeats
MLRRPRLLTRSDFEAEFDRARAKNRVPEITGHGFDLDLSGLDFSSPYVQRNGIHSGVFLGIDLRNCRMQNCNLARCHFGSSNLRGVDLSGSILHETTLYSTLLQYAKLNDADLTGANLISAELDQVGLARTNLTNASFGATAMHQVDLSSAVGLATVGHHSPSAIDSVSLHLTAQGLANEPDFRRRDFLTFLSGAGLDDELLGIVSSWIGKPIEFHSVFISHSSLDKEFARKLYDDLRSVGIKCWLDEKQLLPGDSVLGEIDKGIKLWDRLLLICSRNSLGPTTGWWVEQELERALAKEREDRRRGLSSGGALIPITIDDYVFNEWESPYRATVLGRYIGDFRDRRPEPYAESLNGLVEALDRSRRP